MRNIHKSITNPSANQITEGIIWKQLLVFFFPIVLGTFFQQLYNTVDTIIVGRFVGFRGLPQTALLSGCLLSDQYCTGHYPRADIIQGKAYGHSDLTACAIACQHNCSSFFRHVDTLHGGDLRIRRLDDQSHKKST